MGNFNGHALPGTFFIIFGLWNAIQSLRKYYQCRASGAKFTSTVSHHCSCLCGILKEIPLEGIIKILVTCFGLFAEIITGFVDGKFVAMANGQHATMYVFFGLTGVIDVLIHYKAPLPPNIDYISNALALGVEAVLFNFHLYGRTPLDVLVHILLVYVVIASVICIFVEMKFRHNILSPLTRSFLFILQGTWFWQVGNILYPPVGPKWDEDDHEQLMVAALYFSWHAGAIFIVILIIGAFVSCRYRRRAEYLSNGMNFTMKRLIETSGSTTHVPLVEESESDVEFQKPVIISES